MRLIEQICPYITTMTRRIPLAQLCSYTHFSCIHFADSCNLGDWEHNHCSVIPAIKPLEFFGRKRLCLAWPQHRLPDKCPAMRFRRSPYNVLLRLRYEIQTAAHGHTYDTAPLLNEHLPSVLSLLQRHDLREDMCDMKPQLVFKACFLPSVPTRFGRA